MTQRQIECVHVQSRGMGERILLFQFVLWFHHPDSIWDLTRSGFNPFSHFLLSGHTNRVYSLQFDGVHVVSGSLDTSIRVWDVETGACRHALMVSACTRAGGYKGAQEIVASVLPSFRVQYILHYSDTIKNLGKCHRKQWAAF